MVMEDNILELTEDLSTEEIDLAKHMYAQREEEKNKNESGCAVKIIKTDSLEQFLANIYSVRSVAK